jgi:hypothetical protein
LRYRAKSKISANVDPFIIAESEKIRKKLGFDTFSKYVEYALRSVVKDPKILIRSEMISAQREFTFWRETLEAIEEVEASTKEEGFPCNHSQEERIEVCVPNITNKAYREEV